MRKYLHVAVNQSSEFMIINSSWEKNNANRIISNRLTNQKNMMANMTEPNIQFYDSNVYLYSVYNKGCRTAIVWRDGAVEYTLYLDICVQMYCAHAVS